MVFYADTFFIMVPEGQGHGNVCYTYRGVAWEYIFYFWSHLEDGTKGGIYNMTERNKGRKREKESAAN